MAGPTPENPGTYLPVPGGSTANSQTGSEDVGQTANDIRFDAGAHDGKKYLADRKTATGGYQAAPGTVIPDAVSGTVGPKGDKGDTGAPGPQGPAGATGPQGPKGDKGDKGDAGAAGATGPQGPKGDKGDPGVGGSVAVSERTYDEDGNAIDTPSINPASRIAFTGAAVEVLSDDNSATTAVVHIPGLEVTYSTIELDQDGVVFNTSDPIPTRTLNFVGGALIAEDVDQTGVTNVLIGATVTGDSSYTDGVFKFNFGSGFEVTSDPETPGSINIDVVDNGNGGGGSSNPLSIEVPGELTQSWNTEKLIIGEGLAASGPVFGTGDTTISATGPTLALWSTNGYNVTYGQQHMVSLEAGDNVTISMEGESGDYRFRINATGGSGGSTLEVGQHGEGVYYFPVERIRPGQHFDFQQYDDTTAELIFRGFEVGGKDADDQQTWETQTGLMFDDNFVISTQESFGSTFTKISLNADISGKSAYEVATENGFQGTEAQWLDSLKGADGATGAKGDKGDTGAVGPKVSSASINQTTGILTLTNSDGSTVVAGNVKGDKGDTGEKGDKGDTGATGPQGKFVTSASTTGGLLTFVFNDSTSLNVSGSVKGDKGDKGDTGDTGPTGPTGPAGRNVTGATVTNSHLILTMSDSSTVDAGDITGPAGPQGAKGDTGSQGPTGATGPKGDAGTAGRGITSVAIDGSGHLVVTYTDASTTDAGQVKGDKGDKGDTGSTGLQGPAGKSITAANVNQTTGELTLTMSDSSIINAGNAKGPAGTAGTNGRGITQASINGSGNLLFTYSDSTSVDLGVVVGAKGDKGDPGTNGNITAVQQGGAVKTANPTAINFTGAGVTVSDIGGVATVNIPGGGSGGGSGTGGGNVNSVRFTAQYTGGAISGISDISNADFSVSYSGSTITITYDSSFGHPITFGCYGDNGTAGGPRTMKIPTGAFALRYTNPGSVDLVGASSSAAGSGAAGTAIFNILFG